MASWNDLPFELKLTILELYDLWLPPPANNVLLEDLFSCPYDNRTHDYIPKVFQKYGRREVAIIEEHFLICKAYSKALIPALKRHIEGIRYQVWVIEGYLSKGHFAYWDQWTVPSAEDLAKWWRKYLEDRRRYAERLLEHVRNY